MKSVTFLTTSAIAIVAFGAVNAVAADAVSQDAMPTVNAFDDVWSGLYVGLEANAMGGTLPQRSNGSDDSYYDMSGSFAPGVFIGLNKQLDNIVLGAEISALFNAPVGDPSNGDTFGSNWGVYNISHLVDLTGRVGFAMDDVLIYASAGGSTGNVIGQYGHDYATWGVNYGIGVDYKVDEELSIGLQWEGRNLQGYNSDDDEIQDFNTSTLSLRAAYHF